MGMRRKNRKADQVAAFENVVKHYEARLIRYAARIIGNDDVAQDVVQDVFVRLYRHWKDAFETSPALSGWLYRVTHNRAVDAVRRRARRAVIEKQHMHEQPEHVEPSPHGVEHSQRARARRALKILDRREQQLVILKVFEEKSYREISEITGLKTGHVGYLLHHAMKKMAAELQRDGDE